MGAAPKEAPPASPTPSQCSDFWDPPCSICKKVDDEPNVLCELCNSAYHLGCIEKQKLKLPRAPTDDEWFCPRCVRKGVPEAIIDRVGRSHGAYYLVKWLGRPSSDVTWECAKTLDTAWSRKLIVSYVREGPAASAEAELAPYTAAQLAATEPYMAPSLLLPPCHPLVDRLALKPRVPLADDEIVAPHPYPVAAPTAKVEGGEQPDGAKHPSGRPPKNAAGAPAEISSAPGLHPAQLDGQEGNLGAITNETRLLLELAANHPERARLADDADPIAARALARAVEALRHAREVCERALSDAVPEAAAAAPAAAAPAAGVVKPTAYAGYLCYLRESRQRLRESQPGASSRQVEKLAAREWKELGKERRDEFIGRAAEQIREKLHEVNLNQMVPGVGKRTGPRALDARRKSHPCDRCGEVDKFDAVTCSTCPARRHLMCFFPPSVEEAPWQCDACAAPSAEQRSLIARALRSDSEARASALLPQVESLYREGIAIVSDGITPSQVESVADVVSSAFERYMLTVRTLDLQEKLLAEGFMQIKMRHTGRYDLQLPELSAESFSFLMRDAPWMPLVHAALGADAQLTHYGCMLSFPNSAAQPWHSDGPHIRSGGDPRFVAPMHAVNVFVPLVDLTTSNGPTEFVPGSHVWHDLDEEPKAPTEVYRVKAGQAILFDYRLKHRGLGNASSSERPLIYITYSRPFFLDVYNFDQKRYSVLPPLEARASRAERVQKRQRVEAAAVPTADGE